MAVLPSIIHISLLQGKQGNQPQAAVCVQNHHHHVIIIVITYPQGAAIKSIP